MSTVQIAQSQARDVAQKAIQWFDYKVKLKISKLWDNYHAAKTAYEALPLWKSCFTSAPHSPLSRRHLWPSEIDEAKEEAGLWRDKAKELLDACGEEGICHIDVKIWGTLRRWAKNFDEVQSEA